MTEENYSRRKFIKTATTGAIGALALPTFIPARAFGANDRVRAAVIGFNSRGKNHIEGFGKLNNVEVVTLCDVDQDVLQAGAKDLEKKQNRKIKTEADMRRVFDDKSIDVVSIATPNHWHALATIWACQAGKDVYVEKPGSHNLFEGRKMVEAANKYNRIVQHGVQLRSSESLREAIQHLRDGLIGNVYMARGVVYKWRPDIGNQGVGQVPANLNWDLWQGPAAEQAYSKNYVHYNWHWFWNYGNGDIGNQGVHETDLCMWGLDVGLPEVISSSGGKFLWKDSKETPELLTTTFNYPKQNKMIQFEVRPWMTNKEDGVEIGNFFYGDKGYMVVNGYSDYKTFLGKERTKGPSGNSGGNHFQNFINAVRARDKKILHAPVETAHLSSGLAHLANISYRLGRQVYFDPQTETFKNDAEANKMLSRAYRPPFVVPKVV